MAAEPRPDWLSRLPSAWTYGVRGDGRIFFINEQAQSTTWLHPVSGEAVLTGHRQTPDLPTGWEEGYTFEGARCFINHNERKVTCKHPLSGAPSQDNCIFVVNEQPAPPTPSEPRAEPQERPTSLLSDNGGSDLSPATSVSTATSPCQGTGHNSSAPPHLSLNSAPSGAARPSRSSKKIHNFGKRSNSIKRSVNAPVVKRGWLYKQDSTGMKLWKKRWFVLCDMCLYYYRDDKEDSILGSILLPSFHVSMLSVDDHINRKYAFKATHPNMRTYYFCSDTAKDSESWMKVMTDAALVQTEPVRRSTEQLLDTVNADLKKTEDLNHQHNQRALTCPELQNNQRNRESSAHTHMQTHTHGERADCYTLHRDGDSLLLRKDGVNYALQREGDKYVLHKDGDTFLLKKSGDKYSLQKDEPCALHRDHNNHLRAEDHNNHLRAEDHNNHLRADDHNNHLRADDHNNHLRADDHNNHLRADDHNNHLRADDHNNHPRAQDHNNHLRAEEQDAPTPAPLTDTQAYQHTDAHRFVPVKEVRRQLSLRETDRGMYNNKYGTIHVMDRYGGLKEVKKYATLREGDRYNTLREGDRYATLRPEGDRYATLRPEGDRYATLRPEGDRYATLRPEGDRYNTLRPEGDRYNTLRPEDVDMYRLHRDLSSERTKACVQPIPASRQNLALADAMSSPVDQPDGSSRLLLSPAPPTDTAPKSSLSRTHSMPPLEPWARPYVRVRADPDTTSISSYQTLPRNMPSHRSRAGGQLPDGYRTLPRNCLTRSDSACTAGDKRRSIKDDTMWQLYEWQQRQAYSRLSVAPNMGAGHYGTLPSAKTMSHLRESMATPIPLPIPLPSPLPLPLALPPSPSHNIYSTLPPPRLQGAPNPSSPHSELASPLVRDGTATLGRHKTLPHKPGFPERTVAGVTPHNITSQSLQGKTSEELTLLLIKLRRQQAELSSLREHTLSQLRALGSEGPNAKTDVLSHHLQRSLRYLERQKKDNEPLIFMIHARIEKSAPRPQLYQHITPEVVKSLASDTEDPDIDAKLSRLCEQDKVVKTQEEKVQQLHREKHTLETALLSACQELSETLPSHSAQTQSLLQQRDVLQGGLLSTCRELNRVAADLQLSKQEFLRLEGDVGQAKSRLLQQLEALGSPQTEPPSQRHIQIQKELWRIQDVMEALAKNKPHSDDGPPFPSSKPLSSISKNETPGPLLEPAPPRPPLPLPHHYPLPPCRPEDRAATPRSGANPSGPDYRLYKSEPELTTVKEEESDEPHPEDHGAPERGAPDRKDVPVTKVGPCPVGIVPPRTKSSLSESSSIPSYVTLRKGKKPEPRAERPHSALEQAGAFGERELGRTRMSVEEQLERIRRNQEACTLRRTKLSRSSSFTREQSPAAAPQQMGSQCAADPCGLEAALQRLKDMSASLSDGGASEQKVEDRGRSRTRAEDQLCSRTEVEDQLCSRTEVEDRDCSRTEVKDRDCSRTEFEDRDCSRTQVEGRDCSRTEAEGEEAQKLSDSDETNTEECERQTAVILDLPQTLKVVELPKTLKVVELPQALKVVELPQTLKVVELPQTLKVVELPQTLDLPQTLKVVELQPFEDLSSATSPSDHSLQTPEPDWSPEVREEQTADEMEDSCGELKTEDLHLNNNHLPAQTLALLSGDT